MIDRLNDITSLGGFSFSFSNIRQQFESFSRSPQSSIENHLESSRVSKTIESQQSPKIHPSPNKQVSFDSEGIDVESYDLSSSGQSIPEHDSQMQDMAEQRRAALKKYADKILSLKKDFFKSQQKLQWQGFTLTKNPQCSIAPFFCGKCKLVLPCVDRFVTHCIEECQMTKHRCSSHSIQLNLEEQVTKVQQQSTQTQFEQTIQENLLLKYQNQVVSTGKSSEANIKDVKPLRTIIRKGLDHRKLPFFCGPCHKNFARDILFYNHIHYYHKWKIDPSSSHIILKCQYRKNSMISIFLSQTAEWAHNNPIYQCPCQPGIKISMKQLVKHVMQIHKGVSPVYALLARSNPKQKSSTYNKETIEKQAKKDPFVFQQKHEDESDVSNKNQTTTIQKNPSRKASKRCVMNPMIIMLTTKKDDRQFSFFCGACSLRFNGCIAYYRHFQKHNNVIDRSSSHVILQVITKSGKKNKYILTQSKSEKTTIFYCPCQPGLKMELQDLIEHIFDEHQGISPAYPLTKINQIRAIEEQFLVENHSQQIMLLTGSQPIKKIVNMHILHKMLIFHCAACDRNFSPEQYAIHIVRVHKKIVQPGSSHILIKITDIRRFAHYFCISLEADINDDESELYCPCNPNKKMKISRLIRHVLEEHRGVSPAYSVLAETY